MDIFIRGRERGLDFVKFLERQGGLASAIQNWIVEHGFHATDRGGGGGGWHIGVPFDSLDNAADYLHAITEAFSKAIVYEELRFELKTWSASVWEKSKESS